MPKRKGSPAWSPRLCNILAWWSTSSLHLPLSLEVLFSLFISLTTAVIFWYRARKHCPNVPHPTGSWEILLINERSISRTDLEVLLGCFSSLQFVVNLIVGARVLLNNFGFSAEISGLLNFAGAIIFWPLLKRWLALCAINSWCFVFSIDTCSCGHPSESTKPIFVFFTALAPSSSSNSALRFNFVVKKSPHSRSSLPVSSIWFCRTSGMSMMAGVPLFASCLFLFRSSRNLFFHSRFCLFFSSSECRQDRYLSSFAEDCSFSDIKQNTKHAKPQ